MIDAVLFCEIIESDPRVTFLREEYYDPYIFRKYQGLNGLVTIDFDNDTFNNELGTVYLTQLGLWDLIKNLYPIIDANNQLFDPECETCKGKGVVQNGDDFETCSACLN